MFNTIKKGYDFVTKKVDDLYESATRNVGKGVAAAAAAFGLGALPSDASAALTAADIDTAPALADLAIAVISVLGVAVVIFGYKRVIGMFGR